MWSFLWPFNIWIPLLPFACDVKHIIWWALIFWFYTEVFFRPCTQRLRNHMNQNAGKVCMSYLKLIIRNVFFYNFFLSIKKHMGNVSFLLMVLFINWWTSINLLVTDIFTHMLYFQTLRNHINQIVHKDFMCYKKLLIWNVMIHNLFINHINQSYIYIQWWKCIFNGDMHLLAELHFTLTFSINWKIPMFTKRNLFIFRL